MGKKKKRPQARTTKAAPNPLGNKTIGGPKLDPEQQKTATERLVKLFKALGDAPETILDMFERLELPYEKVWGFEDDSNESVLQYITIKWSDLLAAEKRNQDQGSIAKRLYGEKVAAPMEPKIDATGADSNVPMTGPEGRVQPKGSGTVTVTGLPPNTHNPETGVPIDFEHDSVQLKCDEGVVFEDTYTGNGEGVMGVRGEI